MQGLGTTATLGLLAAVGVIGEPAGNPAWPWPAPRLSYANAAIAKAVIVAGLRLGGADWLGGVGLCVAWFLGDNDVKAPMLNPHAGGGHDSLGPSGRSPNQDARSTLAIISVLQQGRRVSAVRQ